MKKVLLSLLQIAVTIAVLFWVFHDPQKRAQMAIALRMADYRWIAGAVLAYFVVEFVAAIRWHILLKVQKIHLSIPRVSGLFLIGMFYNQFLPGGTGGDIMKSYLLLKETPGKATGALLAVVFDRMIGLIGLISITGALIALRYDWLTQLPETKHLVWLLIAILGSAILMLVTSFVVSGFNLAHSLPVRFPGREKLIELSASYHLYAHHWRATLAAFGASIIAHLSTFATFLCVAYAFRARVGVLDFFAIMPIERTISSLPISFAGVGLREKIFQVMLHGLCGVPEAVAVLIGSMSFLVMLISCAPGGIVYFFYKPSGQQGHVKLREMREKVVTLEHEISESE
ncbi:MAG: flippase-like domain-containing protein [Chthoniobacterales bacterium]|nr:flippase-like domain-containing protein [Chthoniobacterales bacterium]